MAQPYRGPCDEGLIDAQPCPRALGREVPRRQRRAVLAACVLASSMAFIDGSALTVALPDLRTHFGADLVLVQWVVNGYVLTLAALTLIGGALADVYGKARMLIIGCAGFGLASIACALAPNPESLIIARLFQGAAAAIVTPASLALIGATFPKDERNKAIGIWAAASALTTAGGPVLGGFLTEQFGWQAIFWINIPLAITAIGLLLAMAPKDRLEARRFDMPGAILLAMALGAVAWALSSIGPGEAGAHEGEPSLSIGMNSLLMFIGGLGLLGLYAVWEQRSDHPMTPPRLFANAPFTRLNVATLLIYAGLSIMFFLLPFELIERRNLSATQAGLIFLPFTLGVGLLSRLFGGMADQVGGRLLLMIGPTLAAIAYIWLAVMRDASLLVGVLLPMGLLGLAFALLVAPLTAAVMSSVPETDEGLASGMNNAASRIAQLSGIALAAGISAFSAGFAIGLTAAMVLSLAAAGVVALIRREAFAPQGN